jgi:hypothetical protein
MEALNPPINTSADGNFAVVSVVPNHEYFEYAYNEILYAHCVRKIDKPLVDFQYYKFGTSPNFTYLPLYGHALTLCGYDFEFERLTYPPEKIFRLANAHGFYQLFRPGIHGREMVYFSFPWLSGLWYSSSPDMTIHFK